MRVCHAVSSHFSFLVLGSSPPCSLLLGSSFFQHLDVLLFFEALCVFQTPCSTMRACRHVVFPLCAALCHLGVQPWCSSWLFLTSVSLHRQATHRLVSPKSLSCFFWLEQTTNPPSRASEGNGKILLASNRRLPFQTESPWQTWRS